MGEPTEALYPALAFLCRFVTEVFIQRILHLCPNVGLEALEVLHGGLQGEVSDPMLDLGEPIDRPCAFELLAR